jgi:hypothetical protein
MKPLYRVCALTCAALLVLALGAPALAAVGWRVVFSHHYGPAANYSAYTAVAAADAGDAWAFGSTNIAGVPAPGTSVAERWDGTQWSRSSLPSGLHSEINAASVVSASSLRAVTQGGGDILHWNSSQWSVADQVPGSGLLFTGITAVSDRDVWAFGCSVAGPGTGTWHFDGHTWTQVTGSAIGLVSASAVSASNIWAIGTTATGPCGDLLTHYSGTSWQPVTATALNGLLFSSILALSRTNVWATAGNGDDGQAQLVHFNGSTWTSIKAPIQGSHWTTSPRTAAANSGWIAPPAPARSCCCITRPVDNGAGHRLPPGTWARSCLCQVPGRCGPWARSQQQPTAPRQVSGHTARPGKTWHVVTRPDAGDLRSTCGRPQWSPLVVSGVTASA